MTTRFYAQNTRWDCGSIAVLNALRYYKHRINPKAKKYTILKKILKCKKPHGTAMRNMSTGMRKLGFPIVFKNKITIDEIIEYLQKGNTMIINYVVKQTSRYRQRHYVYIPGFDKHKCIDVCNMFKNINVIGISKKDLMKECKKGPIRAIIIKSAPTNFDYLNFYNEKNM